jgi:sugar/nucleoside kinase (ribokinase family)
MADRGRRLNVLVAGFITIDKIELHLRQITSIGGPPCYAGLLCARFGFDVTPLTKVGPDFPDEQIVWLARNGLQLRAMDRSSTKKTTRFKLVNKGEERSLYLVERCEDISVEQVPDKQFNASLISPLAHEVSVQVFEEVRKRSDFCFLDPQGFVRMFDASGRVVIDSWSDDKVLGNVDALKMDLEEANALTGTSDGKAALLKLSRKGVRKAVVTRGGEPALVLDGNKISEVEVPKVKVLDSTGAGDIFAGSLISCFLRSRDFLWSCCFGIAASSMSLTSIALGKIELPHSVDQQARKLYGSATTVETV